MEELNWYMIRPCIPCISIIPVFTLMSIAEIFEPT